MGPGRTITWLLIEPAAGLTIWYRPWICAFGPATVTFNVGDRVTVDGLSGVRIVVDGEPDDDDDIKVKREGESDWDYLYVPVDAVALVEDEDEDEGEDEAVFVHDLEGLEALPYGTVVANQFGDQAIIVNGGYIRAYYHPEGEGIDVTTSVYPLGWLVENGYAQEVLFTPPPSSRF